MIFGTHEFLIDSRTGKKWQKCIADVVVLEMGRKAFRSTILADEGNQYIPFIMGENYFDFKWDEELKMMIMWGIGRIIIQTATEVEIP